jgi:monoamine oxidase
MFALACFLFGEYATKCSKLPPAQRLQVVKDQLAVMVGPELRHHVHATIQTIEKQWLPEQWVEGAPCPMVPPGGLWARLGNELRRPWRNLHFTGTETAYEWKGYMEGAVRAGERGAGEVIEAFRGVGPALAAKL